MVFIQTKGGTAPRPKEEDRKRLARLARIYGAKAVVLAEWKKGTHLQLYCLEGRQWRPTSSKEIFGTKKKPKSQ
jgi:hypothetical protein